MIKSGRGNNVLSIKIVLFQHQFELRFLKLLDFSIAAPIYEMEKHCNIEIAGQVSRLSSRKNGNNFSILSLKDDHVPLLPYPSS